MNAVTISILSLLLALTASGGGNVASKKTTDSEQVETSKNNTNGSLWGSLVGTSGVNLNHNETLVRDTQFKPRSVVVVHRSYAAATTTKRLCAMRRQGQQINGCSHG